MADSKTTVKKTTPAKTTKAVKSEVSVQDQLAAKRLELHNYRKSNLAGELVNPPAITVARKEVARLMTQLNAKKESN